MTLFKDHPLKWKRMFPPKGTLWDRNEWPGLWEELRQTVICEANYRCQGCGDNPFPEGSLDVHHIDSNEFNMHRSNLIALCKKHHRAVQDKPLPTEWLCPDCKKPLVWENRFHQICPDFLALVSSSSPSYDDPVEE